MAERWPQLKLLLWKDYLIRKRKWVTLLGILWAVVATLSLYIVRANLDSSYQNTCHYPARAMPTAGMVPFLQSFLCTINNQCLPFEQYEEIPGYEKSKLRKIEKKLSGMLYNDTILEVAGVMPDALKMIATLTKALDEPDLHSIAKNGLTVSDLFIDADRVKRFISLKLQLDHQTTNDFMDAKLNYKNIFNLTLDQCIGNQLSKLFLSDNETSIDIVSAKLCSLTKTEMLDIGKQLLYEINFRKYIKLIGNIIQNINGEDWIITLADMTAAVTRLVNFDNFVPYQFWPIFKKGKEEFVNGNFSYFDVGLVKQLISAFEPTFGNTETFKNVKAFLETSLTGITWIETLISREIQKDHIVTDTIKIILKKDFVDSDLRMKFMSFVDGIDEELRKSNDSGADILGFVSKLSNGVATFLPAKEKHDMLYYLTLLTQLCQLAHDVAMKNINIEAHLYEVLSKRPGAVKILSELPVNIVGNAFDALTDAERTQMFTSKMYTRRKFFCDVNHLSNFLKVSNSEAVKLKGFLCEDEWNDFVAELIGSFGIFDVRKRINTMASLVVMETLGKDTSASLLSLDEVFGEINLIIKDAKNISKNHGARVNWSSLFNSSNSQGFLRVVREKSRDKDLILITIHGAFAKEVIRQNPILEAKITPIFIQFTELLASFNQQINDTPTALLNTLEMMYPQIVKTALYTLTDADKTFHLLSKPSKDIFCTNATEVLIIPKGLDREMIFKTLCDVVNEVEKTLNGSSKLGNTIISIKQGKIITSGNIVWNQMISNMKHLHVNLNKHFSYLIRPKLNKYEAEIKNVTQIWLSGANLDKVLHMSIKMSLWFMDILESPVFDMSNDDQWKNLKGYFTPTNSFLKLFTKFAKYIFELWNENPDEISPDLSFPKTMTILKKIIPNFPNLLRVINDVIRNDNASLPQVIEVLNSDWPCDSKGLSESFNLNERSLMAMRGIEELLCYVPDIQMEWTSANEVKAVGTRTTSSDTDNFFLDISRNFDLFINEMTRLNVLVYEILDKDDDNYNKKYDLIGAIEYSINFFNETVRNTDVMSNILQKIDVVLKALKRNENIESLSLSKLWNEYLTCSKATPISKDCKLFGKSAWIYSVKFMATSIEGVIKDLWIYFDEVSDDNSNVLQAAGFTKNTGLYLMYDKFADFVGVLLNSYLDQGFMNQVRRATQSSFWDCSGMVDSLIIPIGSRITKKDIARVKPYVCPTVLFWVSLPLGDNTLLNLVSRTQYNYYTATVGNLTGSYDGAFQTATKLKYLLNYISNKTKYTTEPSPKESLDKNLNLLLNYNISQTDPSYVLFNNINQKQIFTVTYVTKLTILLTEIEDDLEKTNSDDKDMKTLLKLIKRRPSDILEILFDMITRNSFDLSPVKDLTNLFDDMCAKHRENITEYNIISDNKRIKSQICERNFRSFLSDNEKFDFQDLNSSLLDLINETQLSEINFEEFWTNSTDLKSTIKQIISYSDDLEIHVYLKYLHSILNQNDVVITFLSGGNWWEHLLRVYNGRGHSEKFFKGVEGIFEVAEDLLEHVDRIKVVQLLRAINLNDTESFCQDSVQLSDYIPDKTGILSDIKRSSCSSNKVELFREITPLLFASQGYESELTITKEVNYTQIKNDISSITKRLKYLKNGPRPPARPTWITDEKLQRFKNVTGRIFSKTSVAKMSFAAVENMVDAVTLFLNTSRCESCSTLTIWFKQVRLQLIKKLEYELFLCRIKKEDLDLESIYTSLKDDFHWDLAIEELTSKRNYTNVEMNRSVNALLDLIKTFYFQSLQGNEHKHSSCHLDASLGRNIFGNISVHTSTVTKLVKMLRALVPHLYDLNGIKSSTYMETLSKQIAPKLSVLVPLSDVRGLQLEDCLVKNVFVDVSKVQSSSMKDYLILDPTKTFDDFCGLTDCQSLSQSINQHFNHVWLKMNLLGLQQEKFRKMEWLSSILQHVENFLENLNKLVQVTSRVDLEGISQEKLEAIIDFLIQIQEEMDLIISGLKGIVAEMGLVASKSNLIMDLSSLTEGLDRIAKMRDRVLERESIQIKISMLFKNYNKIEEQFSDIGLNMTNFWSVAAKRIYNGYVDFKPLISPKSEGGIHSKAIICSASELTPKIIVPSSDDMITSEDILTALAEQFCGISDKQARASLTILMKNLNYSFIFDQIFDALLLEMYKSSNLTNAEGKLVVDNLEKMVSILPDLQKAADSVSSELKNEPLLEALRSSNNVKNLLGSSTFMKSAGEMLCGHTLVSDSNRFYQAIAATQDFNNVPDPKQLEALPTDYCRDLYRDVLNLQGGKIVWSFVKPLVMGKILYTPSNDVVDGVIEKANKPFSKLANLRTTIRKLSRSFDAFGELRTHKASFETLDTILSADVLVDAGFKVPSDFSLKDLDIDDVLEQIGDLESTRSLVTRLSNLMDCVNLDRFIAQIDESVLSENAAQLTLLNEFSAGLVFINSDLDNITYKIRMDIDSVPTTSRIRNQLWTPGPEDNFLEDMRYFRGFAQIQDLVNRAIVDIASNATPSIGRKKRQIEEDVDWSVYTQQMPYPCYKKDIFQRGLYESSALVVCMFFALVFTVASAVRFIVTERETGNTYLMRVMGMNGTNHTISWFIVSLAEMTVTVTGIFLVLHLGDIMPNSDPLILWLLLVNFGFSVVCFCYMISKFFNSASVGGVSAGVFYLITFMPFTILLSLEAALTTVQKVATSLVMSTAFSYCLVYLGRLEVIQEGVQWSNVFNSPWEGEKMSVASISIIILFDSALYLVIGMAVEWFKEYRNTSSNLITEDTPEDNQTGVEIQNLCAHYSSRNKMAALDDVSMTMRRGQITALLGHNGAGKSTLVKIITGLLKPSKGTVRINGRSCEDCIGNVKLGLCPQNDVLIENMTAAEHFQFYAQLKTGLSYTDIEHEVKRMLVTLGAGGLAYEPVYKLSGGMRRRVCVAIAFVARPALVLLDECSSGVDPLARRDIWSLIVRLKKDRTVLITTHHLDEAEILSDQVVILHKGKVHTHGTPLEIKRNLGEGYKMTLRYTKSYLTSPLIVNSDKNILSDKISDNNTQSDNSDWAKMTNEDRANMVLDIIGSVVKNAKLLEVTSYHIVVVLPFTGVDGLDNNFVALTQLVESKQQELRYDSYSMDCSSLEQVFQTICGENDTDSDDGIPLQQSASSSTCESKTKEDLPPKLDKEHLVPQNNILKAGVITQINSLLYKRYIHYTNNFRLFMLALVVPTVFMILAMAFSLIRPPIDSELPLKLTPDLYPMSTDFYVRGFSDDFGGRVMDEVSKLRFSEEPTEWTPEYTPECVCEETKQSCNRTILENEKLPNLMSLPNTTLLMDWIVNSHDMYIQKRYGGWSTSQSQDSKKSYLKVWYSNKGPHSMPAYTTAIYTAALRARTHSKATITTYSHPLKISQEQISRNTLLQHVADVGISSVVLIGYSLIPAAAVIYIITERISQEKRLQLLSGVHPITYWVATILWDSVIICLNIIISVIVMKAFDLPVFVDRDNLKAVCLLLFLFGYSCNAMTHLLEKLFTDASLANMMLFCTNLFVGAVGLTILLIMDIISNSEATDNARNILQKIFLISPQFALGDGLLNIAKNTIQAQVLNRFGMDTYKSPLEFELIGWNYLAMFVIGTLLIVINFAIEMDLFDGVYSAKKRVSTYASENKMEDLDVATERYRVEINLARADNKANPQTNHGFMIEDEERGYTVKEIDERSQKDRDILEVENLRKEYRTMNGPRVAVQNLTFGVSHGQCLGLLGVNGAGKSTTFKMLTGEQKPTGGNIYLNGTQVGTRGLCGGEISYCPQNDALDFLLTPRQMLRFYCKIRGIHNDYEITERTLKAFDLTKYSDQKVSTLSGGNKRKLSTAIAFMGPSTLVLLDEPTSGLDAYCRVRVGEWCTSACRTSRGVLVTSHALTDLTHIATRLALIDKGVLKAIATPYNMHKRFGSDYMVSCRISDLRDSVVSQVSSALLETWPHLKHLTTHHNTLTFLLPQRRIDGKTESEVRPSELFTEFSKFKTLYPIDDFTVNESTLDQVFVNFSRKDDEKAATLDVINKTDDLNQVTAL